MNHDREIFRRLVETARPVQAAHLDSLRRETRRRQRPVVVPATVLLSITVLLVIATIASLSAARRFPSDSRVAQTDRTATAPQPTIAPATAPTATALRTHTSTAQPSPTATPEPSPTVAPAEIATREVPPAVASPTPTTVKCAEPTRDQLGVTGESTDYPKLTFEQMRQAADYILIGTVQSVGVPRWNTADGCYEEWNDVGIMLYKPVRLEVERVLKDKVGVPLNIEYALYDERLGDIGQRGAEDPPKLVEGRRYIFFSRPSLNKQTQRDTSRMILEQAYPIDAENRVMVGPGNERPLAEVVEQIQGAAEVVRVEVDCYGKPQRVMLDNQTGREITLESIGASHYDRDRERTEVHDEVKLNRKLGPGERYTYRPESQVFNLYHLYESVRVSTSYGSVAVDCNEQDTSIREGQRAEPKVPAQVSFRLTLNGPVPPGESFEVAFNELGQHDVTSLLFCGKPVKGGSGPTCEGNGRSYTGYGGPEGTAPTSWMYPAGTTVNSRFIRRSAGGKTLLFREETRTLTEDTTIEVRYEYP